MQFTKVKVRKQRTCRICGKTINKGETAYAVPRRGKYKYECTTCHNKTQIYIPIKETVLKAKTLNLNMAQPETVVGCHHKKET